MDFKGKTVWITGASSGIGKGLALAFSDAGANVILSARNEEALNAVKKQCKHPDKAAVLPLDLVNFDSFPEKVKEAKSFFNGIDILVNNGGVSQRSFAMDTRLDVDRKIFDVNYFGTIGLTKTLLPEMLTRKSGHIIVISSVMGKIGTPLRSAYAGSKHALHGFFDSLRAELYQNNIGVTIVCPGYVKTNVSKNALTGDGSKFNKMDEATGKGLEPEDLARKILKAVSKGKEEVVIGGFKETMAIYLKRFFPKILSKVVRKVNVT